MGLLKCINARRYVHTHPVTLSQLTATMITSCTTLCMRFWLTCCCCSAAARTPVTPTTCNFDFGQLNVKRVVAKKGNYYRVKLAKLEFKVQEKTIIQAAWPAAGLIATAAIVGTCCCAAQSTGRACNCAATKHRASH